MSEPDALSAFRSAGVEAVSSGIDMYLLVASGHSGSVQFSRGKLVFADREWISEDKSDLEAVLGALQVLAQHRTATCTVEHAPLTTPEQNANRIFVSCGKRSILILKGSLDGKPVSSISEGIGSFHPN